MGEVHHHHYHQLHHPHRRSSIATVTAIAFLILASATAIGPTPTQQLGGERESREEGTGSSSRRSAAGSGAEDMEGVMGRRRLGGPGSSPPTCRSKCGRCTPCKPVHVPIQPGFSLPLEYYPEAWRCKCGNKLFMP